MTMHSTSLDKAAILQQLADNLPTSLLKKIFADIPPDEIRDVLTGKSQCAYPRTKQQPLFPSKPTRKTDCSLFTDGASRGNPGEAGAGITLLDGDNREIAARSAYLGQCTNNVAEYQALILGLQTARECGCCKLAIFMDSQLIVRQLTGQYKVKNAALKPLFAKARELLKQFDSWRITHVPREQNKRADQLANRGIDDK